MSVPRRPDIGLPRLSGRTNPSNASHTPGLLSLAGSPPPPRVRVESFGDSSLEFSLLVDVEFPAMTGRVTDELNVAIYKSFNREGIEIPFPQRDVHMRMVDPGKNES